MRVLRSLAAVAVTAATTGLLTVAGAPAAHAEFVCREATMDDYQIAVACAWVETNASGTTVAPVVWIGCQFLGGTGYCDMDPVVLGATGWESNPAGPTVRFDPRTLSVWSDGGTIGWAWVNGRQVPVTLPSFCVGDPAVC